MQGIAQRRPVSTGLESDFTYGIVVAAGILLALLLYMVVYHQNQTQD